MMKVYKGNKRTKFFYLIGQMTVNDEVKHHVCIFEESKYEVHIFSKYFTDKMCEFTLKDKALGTIEHFHLTFIIRFLNYIFNDSKTPINKIEDLTLNMVEEFLDNFSQAKLPGDDLDRWRSKDTVNRANYAISHFVYWLWWKKVPNTSRKMFKMKNFRKDDFEFYTKNIKIKRGTKQVPALSNLVVADTTDKKFLRNTGIDASKYTISKLIEISSQKDPMMIFAIVLGAYAGLRLGDICQMHEGRIKGLEKGQDFGAYFDFTYDTILRSDNRITSNCKTKRLIPIYEGCTSAIYDYYQKHINYLKANNLYPNKYGAIFIDNNGNAMKSRTLQRRFNAIVETFEVVAIKEATLGNIDAKKEVHTLKNGKVTVQSLRRYFKQLIEKIEGGNKRRVQYYMTHKNLNTQDEYGVADTTLENIRKCQNEIYRPIKGDVRLGIQK